MANISAREFYTLQKMKRQGKLNNNPKASALIDEITRTLSKKQQDVPSLESLLQPTINKPQADINTKANKKRKSKKKKAIPTEPEKQQPAHNLITGGSSNQSEHSCESPAKLSRKQRRKLRKQSHEIESVPGDIKDASIPIPTTMTGHKRPSPDSPTNTISEIDQPNKKSRTDQSPPALSTVQVNKDSSKKGADRIPELLPTEQSKDEDIVWNLEDPIAMGEEELAAIIAPVSVEQFFKKYFEKHPLRVQRNSTHYDDWLSTRSIDSMLRKERVMFGEHLDLTSYKDGQRYTLNPPGRAFRSVVWDHYNMGCSIRLLCPQVFFPHIRYRLGLLQEYFGCFVGANVYLTPPGTQGFAPHYDDIEAFIMQLEGMKNWRVYAPRNSSETLPCESSPNFTQEELGKPLMTVTLKPGDLLYLPRGFIHQGSTPDDTHSLHLTISTYQKHSWGEFLSKLFPIALKSAMETNVEFRQGLPVGFLRYVGGFSRSLDTPTTKKTKNEAEKCEDELRRGVVQRLRQLADDIEKRSRSGKLAIQTVESESPDPLLVTADHMAVDLIAQSLPPVLREDELSCHVQRQGERWTRAAKTGTTEVPSGVVDVVELEPDTEIRLVRWSAVRALRTRISTTSQGAENSDGDDVGSDSEDDDEQAPHLVCAMYHSLSNTNVYKERELEELALDIKHLPALDCLVKTFPDFIAIEDLPLESLEDKRDAAIGLYEAGLIVTRYPLMPAEETDTGDEDVSSTDSRDQDSESEESDAQDRQHTVDLDAESVERVDITSDDDDEDDDSDEDEYVEDLDSETVSESDSDSDDEDDEDIDDDSVADDDEFAEFVKLQTDFGDDDDEDESSGDSQLDFIQASEQKALPAPTKPTLEETKDASAKAQSKSKKRRNRNRKKGNQGRS